MDNRYWHPWQCKQFESRELGTASQLGGLLGVETL